MSRELSGKKGRRPLSMAGASQMVTPAAPRAELLTEGGHQHEVIAVPLPAPAQTSQSYQRYSSRMSMTLARGGSSDSVIDLRRIGSDDDDTTKESYVGEKLSFFRSLPRSCRAFLFLTLVVTVTNTVHGVVLIAMGGVMHAESVTRAKNFLYYGVSQVMLGLRIFKFAWDFLRKEHSVYMQMALLLIVYIALFDLSLLESVLSGDDAARAEGGGDAAGIGADDWGIVGHPALRSIFLLVQLLCFAGMVHFGRRASRDFGWRVFKLCGNDFERKKMYDTLYAVSAYAKMDLTLTIQVPLAAPARPRPPPGAAAPAPPGTRAAPRRPARRRRRSPPPPPPLAPSKCQVGMIAVIFLLHGEQAIFESMGEKIVAYVAMACQLAWVLLSFVAIDKEWKWWSRTWPIIVLYPVPPAPAHTAARRPARLPALRLALTLRPPPALLRVQVGPHFRQ